MNSVSRLRSRRGCPLFLPVFSGERKPDSRGLISGDSSIGRALALLSPAHDCVIYFLMGPENEAGTYEQTLDELATSTRFVDKFDGNRAKEGV